jgi:N-acylglucosamine-6-phosphate 2-epimerase
MKIHPALEPLRGGLIVSCQPDATDRANDPMNSPLIMAAMARAAVLGGAVGIRADGPADIAAIRAAVKVPIIGIYKSDVPGFPVRITPTVEFAVQIAQAGADLIALDATNRLRPNGLNAEELVTRVRAQTGKPVLADVSTFEEGVQAAEFGADAILPTLAGYTEYSRQMPGPDFELIERLARSIPVPVIAEGKIATPEQAAHTLELGAWAVCVGSAITRPRYLTERFVSSVGKAHRTRS